MLSRRTPRLAAWRFRCVGISPASSQVVQSVAVPGALPPVVGHGVVVHPSLTADARALWMMGKPFLISSENQFVQVGCAKVHVSHRVGLMARAQACIVFVLRVEGSLRGRRLPRLGWHVILARPSREGASTSLLRFLWANGPRLPLGVRLILTAQPLLARFGRHWFLWTSAEALFVRRFEPVLTSWVTNLVGALLEGTKSVHECLCKLDPGQPIVC
jgi:hypothetical protein